MGCVNGKQAVSVTPAIDNSGVLRGNGSSGRKLEKKKRSESVSELSESGRASSNGGGGGCDSYSFRLGNLHKYVEGDQVAAGWPAWLTAVAGEAIHGWVPLKADAFEKLEKVLFFFCFS